jgi:hypothetical protein
MRARGCTRERAEDLTQGLFASLLAPGALARVDPSRGRFRDWLRTAARNFLCNDVDRERAQIRGNGQPTCSLDHDVPEEGLRVAAQDVMTPDRIFDRRWAMTVTSRALARVREDYVRGGKAAAFARLEQLLAGDELEVSDADLARAEGRTAIDLRVERCRMKKRIVAQYRRYLREEVGNTVADDERSIDDEIRYLLNALA